MDTRQLAAFCAVVERKSFSQAAERLGVTQPAVSLQIRSLEQRVGRQLFDRSGRRVEPTEAGLRLYASAQRLLQLEEQLLEELAADDEGVVTGTLELGASTGPGGSIVPALLCEFQAQHPDVHVRLAVSGGHPFAGKTVSLEQLRGEPLIAMQEGAGVRQVIEDELRKAGTRLRDLDVRLELGLQESVRSAVLAGHGVTFISRLAIESDLAAGLVATARVRGLNPVREIYLARASGRSETRAGRAFVAFAREHLPT